MPADLTEARAALREADNLAAAGCMHYPAARVHRDHIRAALAEVDRLTAERDAAYAEGRAMGDVEGAARVAKEGIDKWVAAKERIAELTADSRSYVPQELAAEMIDALTRAGMGEGDHGNTLHGMVMEAIAARDTARAEGRREGLREAAEVCEDKADGQDKLAEHWRVSGFTNRERISTTRADALRGVRAAILALADGEVKRG